MKPQKIGVNERSGPSENVEIVAIYVCPNPKCKNYYGSSTMGDLEKEEVIAPSHAKDAGQIRKLRSECPDCKTPRKRRLARLVPAEEVREVERAVKIAQDG